MTEVRVDTVPCRLCATHVARDAAVCPSCGANDPWIPEEPSTRASVHGQKRPSATTDHQGLPPKLTIRAVVSS